MNFDRVIGFFPKRNKTSRPIGCCDRKQYFLTSRFTDSALWSPLISIHLLIGKRPVLNFFVVMYRFSLISHAHARSGSPLGTSSRFHAISVAFPLQNLILPRRKGYFKTFNDILRKNMPLSCHDRSRRTVSDQSRVRLFARLRSPLFHVESFAAAFLSGGNGFSRSMQTSL